MDHTKPDDDASGPIRRSWRRCAGFGLAPAQPLPDVVASGDGLAARIAHNARLVAFAQPVIENLYRQIARSSSMVLLADNQGTILRALGDAAFVARAARVRLAPGAVWSEREMGTNAVGTALLENATLAVCGDQHYLRRNRFLAGMSTPIDDGDGGVLGMLGLASDAGFTPVHLQALLQTMAAIVEDRLIGTVAAGVLTLHFHPTAEALATPLAGVAAFAADGRLLACNRRARQWLQLPVASAPPRFDECFAAAWSDVLDHAARGDGEPLALRSRDRRTLAALPVLRSGNAPSIADGNRQPPLAPRAESRTYDRSLVDLDLGDAGVAEAVRRAQRIADHDIPLLIQGETGTGKEVFARAFHRNDSRRDGPFVAVNCAAIPATLIEVELFGYVAGAYTGARCQGARGKLREAHGGTLFLDEIGDMPVGLQAVLLRALETRRVTPLGGVEEAVDIALVCASHQPLRELVTQGAFRADLFFRLSGMTVALPPLRERSDFDRLVRQILHEERPGRPLRIAPAALDVLRRHTWPGNLRQLRNALRLTVALLGDGDCLTPEHLPTDILGEMPGRTPTGAGAGGSLRRAGLQLMHAALARHGGNISATARELGITRTTLYRKLAAAAAHVPPLPDRSEPVV